MVDDAGITEAVRRLNRWDYSTPTGVIEGYDAADRDGVAIYHTNVLMNVGETIAVVCDVAVTRDEQRKAVQGVVAPRNLAEMEGLGGHGRSVDLRLQKIRRARREREAAREAEAELEL